MLERTVGMQATMKQADLLAWASDERRAAQAVRGRMQRQKRDCRTGRAAIAGMLMALAVRLDATVAMRQSAAPRGVVPVP
jgi:hypothetical protein